MAVLYVPPRGNTYRKATNVLCTVCLLSLFNLREKRYPTIEGGYRAYYFFLPLSASTVANSSIISSSDKSETSIVFPLSNPRR